MSASRTRVRLQRRIERHFDVEPKLLRHVNCSPTESINAATKAGAAASAIGGRVFSLHDRSRALLVVCSVAAAGSLAVVGIDIGATAGAVSWQSSGTRGNLVGAAVVRQVVVHVDRVEAQALQHRDGRRRPPAAVAVPSSGLSIGMLSTFPRFACGEHGAPPVRDPPRTRRRCERRALGTPERRAVPRAGPCRAS